MKTVFGPVPSRRLGQSLGIDPVPLKTCNWNCVYCQLGRTMPITNERKNYFDPGVILAEVKAKLTSLNQEKVDWITFIGSGETCLHSSLGYMIKEIKKLTNLPVAVITNGSLLYLPELRAELITADAVLPSLDAGNSTLYRKINRPHPELTFERLVDGLIAFRREYSNQLWVEVMLMKDINDDEATLSGIASLLDRIQPDEVHILQPTRPPVELYVSPPDEEGLLRALKILGKTAKIILPAEGSFDLGGSENLVEAIVGIITRHPMRESELIETLNHWIPGDVPQLIRELEQSDQVQIVTRNGIRHWSAAPARFPKLNG